MESNKPIFEERVSSVRWTSQMDISALQQYNKYFKEKIIPNLEKMGANVICLLQGVIGTPANTFLQITKYPDIYIYSNAQKELKRPEEKLVEHEQVKLFTAITPHPKEPFPVEDYRPIYSNRTFFIDKKNIELYGDLSYNKVWPLYEAWGCSILGLFSSLSYEVLHEIKLFAGYNSIAHWEKTRNLRGPKPDNIEENMWEEGRNAVFTRAELTFKSNLSLMRTVYLPNEK